MLHESLSDFESSVLKSQKVPEKSVHIPVESLLCQG